MTDYATPNVTVPSEPEDGVISEQWYQKNSANFATEMKAQVGESTVVYSGGSAAARPTVGLVWPR